MGFDGNGGPGAPGAAGNTKMTMMVEGEPGQICRRTAHLSKDGVVVASMTITTLGQEKVAGILNEMARQFAAREGSVVTVGG